MNLPLSSNLQELLRAYSPTDLMQAVEAERTRRTIEAERLAKTAAPAERLPLADYIKEAWHVPEPTANYIHNWHIDAIGEHLQAVHRGEIQRLQINQPPGTMKSLTVSTFLGAWEWGPMGKPGLRYLTTCYNPDYAIRDSRKMRDLVTNKWYQTLWPDIVLIRAAEDSFENTYKGAREAMPFNSLTGERGNRAILDDPHSVETAESDNDRKKTTRKFREGLTSRLNDPARDAIIVMMQRLHPEDVCGVIEELGLPYTKLVLPMEFNRSLVVKTPYYTDPRTEEGELLDPLRTPRDKVEALKIELGPHAYDTQYQQQPRAREGSYYFSRENILVSRAGATPQSPLIWEPVERPTRCDAVIAIIDSASKVGKQRDGTGVLYVAWTKYPEPKAVILDWDLQQITADLLIMWLPGVLRQCEEFAKICGARGGSGGALIEDKDSGMILLQQAARHNPPLKARAIPSEFTSLGKDGRALSVSGYVYKGMMKICREAWEKTTSYKGRTKNHLVDQITTYRMAQGTPTDDDEEFDCFCYAVAMCFGNKKGA